MSLVVCVYIHLGLWEPCTLNCQVVHQGKNKLYTWISGTYGEKQKKNIRTCVKGQLDSGYTEREKTGSIILI